jgi:hypothetical protein
MKIRMSSDVRVNLLLRFLRVLLFQMLVRKGNVEIRLMLSRICAVVCLIAVAAIGSALSAADEGPQGAQTPRMDELANVLARFPLDTETVIVARGPFELKWFAEQEEDEADEPPPLDLADLQHLPIGVRMLRDGAYAKILAGAKAEMAVEGARRFRAPRGLGMGPFEGCQVLILADDKDSVAKLDEVIKRIRQDATQRGG